MQTFKITCTLTDDQVALLEQAFIDSGITVADYFQRFWDGYTAEGIQMDGAVWAQTRQYLKETLQTEIANDATLSKSQ